MLTYAAFNEALRNMDEGVEHPLPVLVTFLARAIKKLRQIGVPRTHTHNVAHTHTHSLSLTHTHMGEHDVAAVSDNTKMSHSLSLSLTHSLTH